MAVWQPGVILKCQRESQKYINENMCFCLASKSPCAHPQRLGAPSLFYLQKWWNNCGDVAQSSLFCWFPCVLQFLGSRLLSSHCVKFHSLLMLISSDVTSLSRLSQHCLPQCPFSPNTAWNWWNGDLIVSYLHCWASLLSESLLESCTLLWEQHYHSGHCHCPDLLDSVTRNSAFFIVLPVIETGNGNKGCAAYYLTLMKYV